MLYSVMSTHLDFNTKIGILDPAGLELNPLTNEPYTESYRELSKLWSTYPTYLKAEEILESVIKNQLTICKAATGTGKTVIVPKLALHYTGYKGKIAISLPKRIITLSAATFASVTLDVPLGNQIGFIYKGSPKEMANNQNRMVYMTDGSLVMKMVEDPLLSEYQVVIVDEAHERKVQIDMLLLFLKKIMENRPDFRVVVMSATIDVDKYQKYFTGGSITSNIINVKGQPQYEIKVNYLDTPTKSYLKDGMNIIESLLITGVKEDMLFFLTTSNEALQLCRTVRPKYPTIYCIEVYSDMDTNLKIYAESRDKYLELGKYDMKLVMATNVAESSVTIDGLKHVIDSCYELYSYYDPDSMSQILETRLISKAQALQRRGRVGRIEPGTCYHLLTKEQFNGLEEYPKPDILRQDLTIDILKAIQRTDNQTYVEGYKLMNELMDKPGRKQFDVSLDLFKLYHMIDDTGKITKVGLDVIKFSSLPINRTLFLIYAFQLHCGREASQILGMIEVSDGKFSNLFFKPEAVSGSRDQSETQTGGRPPSGQLARELTRQKGDHFTFLYIFQKYKNAPDRKMWANKYGLRMDKLRRASDIADQYFYKMVSSVRAPQLGGLENVSVNKRLFEALQKSHHHLHARNMTPTYPQTKFSGQIKESVVLLHYKKKEIEHKRFIYDRLASINGSWEYNTITVE